LILRVTQAFPIKLVVENFLDDGIITDLEVLNLHLELVNTVLKG
jgi:hypothetical protein